MRITLIPSPGIGAVIDLKSTGGIEAADYKITIGTFPTCTCIDFESMALKNTGRGLWYNCKHLCYIFRMVCGMQLPEDLFVHAPTLSFNEIKRVLLAGIVNRIPDVN